MRTVTFTRAYMFYTVIIRMKKIGNFQKCFAENIYCGYSLEPLNLLKKEKDRVYPYTI